MIMEHRADDRLAPAAGASWHGSGPHGSGPHGRRPECRDHRYRPSLRDRSDAKTPAGSSRSLSSVN
jgi:hypothetical protein